MFKVGDKVKIIKPISTNTNNRYNTIGFVFTIGPSFDDCRPEFLSMEGDTDYYTEPEYVVLATPLDELL
jgi:hypothetical protein